jgi:hypothetical protein
MDSDDSDDDISIDSNGSPTASEGAARNHLQWQFRVNNKLIIATAMEMHLFIQYLFLFLNIAPFLRRRKREEEASKSQCPSSLIICSFIYSFMEWQDV